MDADAAELIRRAVVVVVTVTVTVSAMRMEGQLNWALEGQHESQL